MWITRDSGKRQEFDSGMHRDTQEGKPRFDLVTPAVLPYDRQMLTRWAALMERGAKKYSDRNWEQASGPEELAWFKASAFRHFVQWYCGVDDGEDHAAAVFFNVQGAEYVRWKQEADTEAPTLAGEPIGEDGLVDYEREDPLNFTMYTKPKPGVTAYVDDSGIVWFEASNPGWKECRWSSYAPWSQEWGPILPWKTLIDKRGPVKEYKGDLPWS